MNILIDTNVVLDVLLKREPFFKHSQLVLLLSEEEYINGYISASAVTDIFYVTNKYLKNKDATLAFLRNLTNTVAIAAVDSDIILDALDARWNDFEDCVQYSVSESIDADYIVTRNPNDFVNSDIPAISPEKLLDIIAPQP